MPQFQIFSDGACDIKLKDVVKRNVKIIPFYVSLDGEKYYKEIEELSIETFYKEVVEKGIFPKTSLPSVQDYINAFTPSLEAGLDLICFHITDTLSGSFQSATTAKLMLEETYPNAKIYIVNTWLATGAQELLIIEACRMRDAGFTIDKIYEAVEKLKVPSRIFFMVGNLDYLSHGGRIGKLAALSGNILNIKPLIELKNGEVNVAGVARSRKKGLIKLVDLIRNYFKDNNLNPEDFSFTVGACTNLEEIEFYTNALKEFIPEDRFIDNFVIGATIATHTGPFTIGACLVPKYETIL